MRNVRPKILLNATRSMLMAALIAAMLCQSCVRDVEFPEVPQSDWADVPTPPIVNLGVTTGVSDETGTLYLGSNTSHALWRSTDRGRTWTERTIGLNPKCAVEALVVKDGGAIFAALYKGGVFVSRDRGDSWIQVNNHLTDLGILSITVGPGGELVAGTSLGRIFRSENDGGVWTEVEGEPIGAGVRTLITDSAGTIYAGSTVGGVFFSKDGGRTWTSCSEGLESGVVLCLAIDDDGSILAGGYGGKIYRSRGAGAPWVRIDDGTNRGHIHTISKNRTGDILAGTAGHGVLFSRDGGGTWEQEEIGLKDLDVTALLCVGDAIVAGTSCCGAFLSTDGGRSWILPRKYRFIDPTDPGAFGSLSVDNRGTYYLVMQSWISSILRSRDGGETWIRASDGELGWVQCLAIQPNSSLLAGAADGIFISNDSGDSWSRVDTFPSHEYNDNLVRALDVAGNGIVFGRTNIGVIRSTDGGSSWEYALNRQSITSLSTGADSCVYVGTLDEGVLGSSDGGATWKRMTDSLSIKSVRSDHIGNVFARCGSGLLGSPCHGKIHCSNDRGETWREVAVCNTYLEYSVLAAPGGETALVLDEEGVLYESEDGFSTWKASPTSYLGSAMFLSPDGYLFISEQYRVGLHRSRHPLF